MDSDHPNAASQSPGATIIVGNVLDENGIPQFDTMTKDAKLNKELNIEIDKCFHGDNTTPDDIKDECKKLTSLGVSDNTIAYIQNYYALSEGKYIIKNDMECMDVLMHLLMSRPNDQQIFDGCIEILAKKKGQEADAQPILDLLQLVIKYGSEDKDIILASYASRCGSYLGEQLGL
jgi:hypothetical protein